MPMVLTGHERSEAFARADELLALMGMTERANHKPAKLSGGQQQRVALARGLGHRPPLLLADEPTANLDHRTGETVVRMLRDLCSTLGVTVVASTHDPTVADDASRVVRMKDGQIVN
jgi:putative ABC transport system ATP-binding protein